MTSFERLKSGGKKVYMGKKFVRLMQLNSRFCMIFSLILFGLFLILFHRTLMPSGENTQKLHKYILNIFRESCPGESKVHSTTRERIDDNELVWGNYTIELFMDQLGVTFNDDGDNNNDDGRNKKCRSGEFLISALPGPDVENFSEILWQYFTMDALQQMTVQCDEEKRLTLKAVYTERMISHLNQIFDGLPLNPIKNFPSSCYDLKLSKIIGNISPIELNRIAINTPLLLDPKTKRWKEIAMRFLANRPAMRLQPGVVRKVQQKLEVVKTVSQMRLPEDHQFNFIGVYITSDDKLPLDFYQQAINFHQRNSTSKRNIFIVICDPQILIFCRETFTRSKIPAAVNDIHLMRTSTDVFDFVLMSSCNSTIISNDIAVLHALINGGTTVVYKPLAKDDPDFYIPWLVSEKMDNWHSIESKA